MPSVRTFYKSTFLVTVLTEEPYDPKKLRQIADDILTGPHVGTWVTQKIETLDAVQTVAALVDMGSEPEFFFLDAAADDTADYKPAAAVDTHRAEPTGSELTAEPGGGP